MKIEKQHLETLFHTLKGTEGVLNLVDSRVRDGFMKELIPKVDTYGEEKKKIYEHFCLKNKKGEPNIVDGQYHFNTKDVPKVNKELITLGNETVDLPDTPRIKEFIEKTEYKPKAGETEVIDLLLTKF